MQSTCVRLPLSVQSIFYYYLAFFLVCAVCILFFFSVRVRHRLPNLLFKKGNGASSPPKKRGKKKSIRYGVRVIYERNENTIVYAISTTTLAAPPPFFFLFKNPISFFPTTDLHIFARWTNRAVLWWLVFPSSLWFVPRECYDVYGQE